MDESSTTTATTITNSVDVLKAIRWIKLAWNEVKPSTIINCFKHCGIEDSHINEDEDDLEEDPFADFGCTSATGVHRWRCLLTAEEYIRSEEDLATCREWEEHENWREKLRDKALEYRRAQKKAEIGDSEEDTDSETEVEILPDPKCVLQTYEEALECASFLLTFATTKGAEKIAENMADVTHQLETEMIKNMSKMKQQTSMLDHFKPCNNI